MASLLQLIPAREGGVDDACVGECTTCASRRHASVRDGAARCLGRVAPSIDLHTLVSPWAEIDGLPGTTEVVPVRNVPTRFAYEQLRLPFRTADVLYCPADFAPLWSHAPIVLTVQTPTISKPPSSYLRRNPRVLGTRLRQTTGHSDAATRSLPSPGRSRTIFHAHFQGSKKRLE